MLKKRCGEKKYSLFEKKVVFLHSDFVKNDKKIINIIKR